MPALDVSGASLLNPKAMHARLLIALAIIATQPWCYCGAQGMPRPKAASRLQPGLAPPSPQLTPSADPDAASDDAACSKAPPP